MDFKQVLGKGKSLFPRQYLGIFAILKGELRSLGASLKNLRQMSSIFCSDEMHSILQSTNQPNFQSTYCKSRVRTEETWDDVNVSQSDYLP